MQPQKAHIKYPFTTVLRQIAKLFNMLELLKLLFLVFLFLLNDGLNSAPVDQPADDDFECGISPYEYELDGTKVRKNVRRYLGTEHLGDEI
jgi:hypothetical protein